MTDEVEYKILKSQTLLKEIKDIYLLNLQNNEDAINEYKKTILYYNNSINKQEILIVDMQDKIQILDEEINRLKTIIHLKDVLISEIEKTSKTLKEEKTNIYNLYMKIPKIIRKIFAE